MDTDEDFFEAILILLLPYCDHACSVGGWVSGYTTGTIKVFA